MSTEYDYLGELDRCVSLAKGAQALIVEHNQTARDDLCHADLLLMEFMKKAEELRNQIDANLL